MLGNWYVFGYGENNVESKIVVFYWIWIIDFFLSFIKYCYFCYDDNIYIICVRIVF